MTNMIKLSLSQVHAIRLLNEAQPYPTVVIAPIQIGDSYYIGENVIMDYPEYGVVIGDYEIVESVEYPEVEDD